MIDELPEIDNIFSENKKLKTDDLEIIGFEEEDEDDNKEIYIYVSKEPKKWIAASFIDIAPAGIGIHVILPIYLELTIEELNNIKLKFEEKKRNSSQVVKEIPVLVRWQERDPVTGNLKLGLHFPGEIKSDPVIIDILKKLKRK